MSKKIDLKKISAQYLSEPLQANDLPFDPFELVDSWFSKAIALNIAYANSAILSTISNDGFPSSRAILIKEIKDENIIFFTNYNSSKAQDIQNNPKVCINIYWKELDKQIRVKGEASKVSLEESKSYFYSRPKESQVSALISPQSKEISYSKLLELFESKLKEFSNQEVPYPLHWGGYQIKCHEIEFWQGRPNRLHDRFIYHKEKSDKWSFKRLAP